MRARLAAFAAVFAGACSSTPSLPPGVIRAEPWPQADNLFHQEPRWLGGDVAYSIDLGRDRILWLFGDSFIATTPALRRSEATMVRNSIAIQTGRDPTNARMKFAWREDQGGPRSFFGEKDDRWYWPSHGTRAGDRLIIFLTRVRASQGGLGFTLDGWDAVSIQGSDGDDPLAWTITELTTPPFPPLFIAGAALAWEGQTIHVFAFAEPGDHEVYLFDWPAEAAAAGDLSFLDRQSERPIFSPGASEFSVHYDAVLGKWVQIQTIGFGAAELAIRTAPRAVGPWTELQNIYRPPESDREGVLVYAGKAHPALIGADLIATYASNAFDFGVLVGDSSLYYPRFVKIALAQ